MKRLFLALAACLFLSSAIAQVPNTGSPGVPNGGGSGGGGSPTGAAGGSLTGTYPNPGLNLAGTNTGVLPTANGGFPTVAWSSFSPTSTCTGGTLTVNAASQTVGKTTFVSYDVTVATGTCTSTTSDLGLALPNTAATVASAAAFEYVGGASVFCSVKATGLTVLSCRSSVSLPSTSRFSISMVYQNT